MKKIVILLVVLAAVVGIALYKSSERSSRLNRSGTSVKTRELLFPDFENDINNIKKVRVKEDKSEVTLAVQNGTWVVVERGGYPLSKEKLQTVMMTLQYEKIKAGRRIGKDSWSKVGVNSPGDATASGVGTLVELFDDKGNVKYSFVLGGNVSSSGGSNNDSMSMFGGPQGNRFVRLKDEDTIWEIGAQLSELTTKPDAWLDKSFIDIQKIKSVEVTAARPEDSWKASRADAQATDFTLEGAKPGEKIDGGKASLATLLSSPTFNDVMPKDKAADLLKDSVKAKIVTFDGFTYNLQIAKKKEGETDKYFLTVAVTADLPKERAPVKDEKAEDKKKNDDTFAEEKKQLEEKLANEKAFEGWVYDVSEYTVSTLLKKRSEILAEAPKASETPAAPGASNRPAGLPDVTRMIPGLPQVPSATPSPLTNPPPPVPQAPKPELKPAPAPEPAPAAPATAAPAPATSPVPESEPEPAKPAPAEGEKK